MAATINSHPNEPNKDNEAMKQIFIQNWTSTMYVKRGRGGHYGEGICEPFIILGLFCMLQYFNRKFPPMKLKEL